MPATRRPTRNGQDRRRGRRRGDSDSASQSMIIAIAAIAVTIVALYLLEPRKLDRRLETDSVDLYPPRNHR